MRRSRDCAPDRVSLAGRFSGLRSLLLAEAVVLLSATGCSSGSISHPSFTVTDSAGIEIVHSVGPAWTAETAWRVTPEPRLQIGESSGADPYMLDRVMGVTVLDDGGVAIAHMGDNTVRFYDAHGTFVRKVGGHGGGPQEFQQIVGLERHGDEIWGRQFGRLPAKVFDQAGNFLRAESADIPVGMRGGGVRGVFRDGSLLIADWPQSGEVTPRPRLGMSTLVRQAGERTDTLAVVPAVRILPWPGRPGGVYQEFSPKLSLAVAGDLFHEAFPEEYEIIVRDTTGAVRRIIRRDWDPVRVTEAHIARYAEAQFHMATEGGGEVPPQLRDQWQSIVDAQVHPEHHPAFAKLVVGRTGHLWAERLDPDHPKTGAGWHMLRDTPTTWDVFDPNGVWLGSIDLPPRFSPYEFGPGYVAGVWRDDLDVEFVRMYELDQ